MGTDAETMNVSCALSFFLDESFRLSLSPREQQVVGGYINATLKLICWM